MPPRALLRRKYAAISAVARNTINMQSFGLAAIYVAPSIDLESENIFIQTASQVRSVVERVLPPIDVVTGPYKHEVNRDGYHLRPTL